MWAWGVPCAVVGQVTLHWPVGNHPVAQSTQEPPVKKPCEALLKQLQLPSTALHVPCPLHGSPTGPAKKKAHNNAQTSPTRVEFPSRKILRFWKF